MPGEAGRDDQNQISWPILRNAARLEKVVGFRRWLVSRGAAYQGFLSDLMLIGARESGSAAYEYILAAVNGKHFRLVNEFCYVGIYIAE